MTPGHDQLHRFLIENSNVRGELVHLDTTWRTLLMQREYPPTVRNVLGQAISAVALLAATLKFDGSLSMQISGDGPLYMLVVQATSESTLRGLARWRGETRDSGFAELVGKANLIMTIDPGPHRDRYQGIVAVESTELAEVLQGYFHRSEQLPTRLWLAADQRRSAGLLLQRLPGEDQEHEVWNRITHLAGGLTGPDLLDLSAPELLTHLYRREDVRLFSGRPIAHRCGCSSQRVQDTLRALGEEELQAALEDQGEISVRCEYCGAVYRFDAVDFALLFTNQPAGPADNTRH